MIDTAEQAVAAIRRADERPLPTIVTQTAWANRVAVAEGLVEFLAEFCTGEDYVPGHLHAMNLVAEMKEGADVVLDVLARTAGDWKSPIHDAVFKAVEHMPRSLAELALSRLEAATGKFRDELHIVLAIAGNCGARSKAALAALSKAVELNPALAEEYLGVYGDKAALPQLRRLHALATDEAAAESLFYARRMLGDNPLARQ